MSEEPFRPNPLPWLPTDEDVARQLRKLGKIFGIIALAAFAFIGLWVVWEFILVLRVDGGKDGAAIRNVGLIFLAVIGAPFVVYRTWVAGRQTKAAEQQAQLSEDRNFSDLFTKAVEQLGADKVVKRPAKNKDGEDTYDENGVPVMQELTEPNIPVRLGAIYALERISKASENDHIPIMETLCAYVRNESPSSKAEKFEWCYIEDDACCSEPSLEMEEDWWTAFGSAIDDWVRSLPEPRADIQAVLSVMGRRSVDRISYEMSDREGKQEYNLDLSGSNLQLANFEDGNFDFALFIGSRLDGAFIRDSRLNEAKFFNAHLSGTRFVRTELYHARFHGSYMEGATFHGVKAKRADFEFAKVFGGRHFGSDYSSASLLGARFEGSDIHKVEFQNCYLDSSSPLGVKLTDHFREPREGAFDQIVGTTASLDLGLVHAVRNKRPTGRI